VLVPSYRLVAILVIDTNILGVKQPLASTSVQRALDESRRERLRIAIPALVLQELVNSFGEQTEAIEDRRRAAVTQLRQRGVALPDGSGADIDLADSAKRPTSGFAASWKAPVR
jgi:hypothetical protein